MWKYTINIEGMTAHSAALLNGTIKKSIRVRHVESSYKAAQCVIVTAEDMDERAVRSLIYPSGHTIKSFYKEPVSDEEYR